MVRWRSRSDLYSPPVRLAPRRSVINAIAGQVFIGRRPMLPFTNIYIREVEVFGMRSGGGGAQTVQIYVIQL